MHQPAGCGTRAATGAAAEFRRGQRVQLRRRSDRARRRDIGGPGAMARRRATSSSRPPTMCCCRASPGATGTSEVNAPCRSRRARCSRCRRATASRSGPPATPSSPGGAATDTAEAWQCRVDGTARVATKAGDFDTFRVACSMSTVPPGATLTRTFFYAPVDRLLRAQGGPNRRG